MEREKKSKTKRITKTEASNAIDTVSKSNQFKMTIVRRLNAN